MSNHEKEGNKKMPTPSEDKYGPVSDFGLVLKALLAVLSEFKTVL